MKKAKENLVAIYFIASLFPFLVIDFGDMPCRTIVIIITLSLINFWNAGRLAAKHFHE
jgi:hypothetical protein